MKIYRITFIIWIFQIFALTLPQAQITVIQKDWYRGPGTLIRNNTWANDYFRSESLNTLNHNIVFKASEINTANWDTVILLSSDAIESHTHYHYADLDDDGDLDFAMGVGGHGIYVAENIGDTAFTNSLICSFSLADSNWALDTYCGKIDDDEYYDIFFSGRNGYGVCWGSGSTSTGWDCETLSTNRMCPSDGEVCDLNKDGYDDIVGVVFSKTLSADVGIIWGPDLDDTTIIVSWPWNISVGRTRIIDFDKDGDFDIVTNSIVYPNSQVKIIENDSLDFYTFETFTYTTLPSHFDGLGVTDFNSDGFIDIMVGLERYFPSGINGFYWFKNDSGTAFSSMSLIYSIDDYTDGADVADFDLNGYPDIIGGWSDVGYISQVSSGVYTDIELVDEPGKNIHFGRVLQFDYQCGKPAPDFYYTVGNNYFTLLRNNMLKFPSNGFLESTVLKFRKGKKITSFGWSDCVPDGFEVDYYVRAGKTLDKCTTSTWIEVSSSGEDLSDKFDSLCYLHFQYRIEFDRTTGNEKLSPEVDSIFMVLEDNHEFIIDSLWFSEETYCNLVNIVEICYKFTSCDDTFHSVSAYITNDTSNTWAGLDMLLNIRDNYGDSVKVGEHCFDWSLSSDMPDIEGYNWFIKLVVDSLSLISEGPLDSRKPVITFDTLLAEISVGDSISLSFSVVDTFFTGDTSLVFFEYCGQIDSLYFTGTSFNWQVPPDTCESLKVILEVPDSFCNIGSATQYFRVAPCIPETAWVICAPCNDYSACDSQVVEIIIYDYQGFSIDTLNTFFTLLHKHSSDSIDTIHLSEPSSYLNFECLTANCESVLVSLYDYSFSDGDSVSVILDSLYDSRGCRSIFKR